MKNFSKIIIMVVIFLLISFVVTFLLSEYLLYIPSFSYSDENTDMLNNYFTKITQEPTHSKATAKYHVYYDDIDFNYGDVVHELAKYNYTPVAFDEVQEILQTESLDETAYQINLSLYSDLIEDIGVVNAVFFSHNETIYALAFYNTSYDILKTQQTESAVKTTCHRYLDSEQEANTSVVNAVYFSYNGNVYTLESYVADMSGKTTLYKTDMIQYPDNFSAYCFDNHGLIETWFNRAATISKNKAVKISAITIVLEIITIAATIMIVTKKHKRETVL